jgi:hypothetical protein
MKARQPKRHIILGKNRRDAEASRDRWLAENQTIKVLRIHRPRREPKVLLTLIGGEHVPRVSVVIEYE